MIFDDDNEDDDDDDDEAFLCGINSLQSTIASMESN